MKKNIKNTILTLIAFASIVCSINLYACEDDRFNEEESYARMEKYQNYINSFIESAKEGNVEEVQNIIDHYKEDKGILRDFLKQDDKHYKTAVSYAAEKNHEAVLNLIFDEYKNAGGEIIDLLIRNSLTEASESFNVSIICFLLKTILSCGKDFFAQHFFNSIKDYDILNAAIFKHLHETTEEFTENEEGALKCLRLLSKEQLNFIEQTHTQNIEYLRTHPKTPVI